MPHDEDDEVEADGAEHVGREAELAELLGEAPDDPSVLYVGAMIHRLDGLYDKSHRLYDRLLAVNPSDIVLVAINKARLYNYQGRFEEAVAEIARMFGWDTFLGHLTGGGTLANLEALWVAGQLNPHGTVLASKQAHYTHSRISAVLKLDFESVPTDRLGRMDLAALKKRLDQGGVPVRLRGLAEGDHLQAPHTVRINRKIGTAQHVCCQPASSDGAEQCVGVTEAVVYTIKGDDQRDDLTA